MYLKPCRMCPLQSDCEQKQKVLTSLRGTGITSAKFRCDTFLHFYKPGDGVLCLLTEYFYESPYDIAGTVTRIKRDGKIVILLDEYPWENSENGFLVVWPMCLRAIDEPAVKVCPGCGIPEGKTNSRRFWCDICGDNHDDDDPLPIDV